MVGYMHHVNYPDIRLHIHIHIHIHIPVNVHIHRPIHILVKYYVGELSTTCRYHWIAVTST